MICKEYDKISNWWHKIENRFKSVMISRASNYYPNVENFGRTDKASIAITFSIHLSIVIENKYLIFILISTANNVVEESYHEISIRRNEMILWRCATIR
jgi:hypothetical protein